MRIALLRQERIGLCGYPAWFADQTEDSHAPQPSAPDGADSSHHHDGVQAIIPLGSCGNTFVVDITHGHLTEQRYRPIAASADAITCEQRYGCICLIIRRSPSLPLPRHARLVRPPGRVAAHYIDGAAPMARITALQGRGGGRVPTAHGSLVLRRQDLTHLMRRLAAEIYPQLSYADALHRLQQNPTQTARLIQERAAPYRAV